MFLCVIAVGVARVHSGLTRSVVRVIEIWRKVGNTAFANIYRQTKSVCLDLTRTLRRERSGNAHDSGRNHVIRFGLRYVPSATRKNYL